MQRNSEQRYIVSNCVVYFSLGSHSGFAMTTFSFKSVMNTRTRKKARLGVLFSMHRFNF